MFGWDVLGANPAAYDEEGRLMPDSTAPTLDEQVAQAAEEQKTAKASLVELTYNDMTKLFRGVERAKAGEHVTGFIVFTKESFLEEYSEESRTYEVSSDNKAFIPGMGGYSIYGYCLGGTDRNVRLEMYMAAEKGSKDGWKIERCYMTREEYNKGCRVIEAINKEEIR